MEKVEKHIHWVKIDQAAALKLTELTTNPGKVYQLDIKDAPENFAKMKGACSYFVSAYPEPIEGGGLTIGGKMVVGRTDEGTLKTTPIISHLPLIIMSILLKVNFISQVIIFKPQTLLMLK